MNDEYLNWVIEKYDIDYVVHGDDPCIVDGKDVYESAQKLGKYRTIPRTEGVSTTDIVGRMLLMTSAHHTDKTDAGPIPFKRGRSNSETRSYRLSTSLHDGYASDCSREDENDEEDYFAPPSGGGGGGGGGGADDLGLGEDKGVLRNASDGTFLSRKSNFMPTSRMMRLYSSRPPPVMPKKIVYIDGGWDMFHPGHVQILQMARARGDYLIVGVFNDAIVNKQRGLNYPVLNLYERVLSVLQCRYVDDVVVDPPMEISEAMINQLQIKVVVQGTSSDDPGEQKAAQKGSITKSYEVPRKLGIFEQVKSPSTLCVETLVERIAANRERLAAKIKRKAKVEEEFYENKHGAGAE